MARARSLSERLFVSKQDLEGDQKDQTRWKVRTPTAREKEEILNAQQVTVGQGGKARTIHRMGSFQLEVLRMGLVGAENFLDEDGKHHDVPVLPRDRKPYPAEVRLMDEFISRIDPETQDELFTEIWGRVGLSEEERGNSDSRSG